MRHAPWGGAGCRAAVRVPTLCALQVGSAFALGHGTEVSPPSQMRGLCQGSIPLLTRNFGLCTLELVKFLENLARLEHGSLNRQNLVLCPSGTRWDNCKGPNSDLHCLKVQARRGSVGRAAQGREGSRMMRVALGTVFWALLRRPKGTGWARGRRQGSPSSARAVSGCTGMRHPRLCRFLESKGKTRRALSWQRPTIQRPPSHGGDMGAHSGPS